MDHRHVDIDAVEWARGNAHLLARSVKEQLSEGLIDSDMAIDLAFSLGLYPSKPIEVASIA